MTLDATALPSELLVPPQPLIGFAGLDITKSSIHKTIWDTFNNNKRPERGTVQYKLLPPNYEFPVSKPKRASYEWYHPKGIFKRNWMLKHLHVLPAVVVLFQDLEWNDPQWSEKQLHCASLIQSLKNNLQGRNTRLALVLIQKTSPLPASEDLFASERAASLTTSCAISAKMLFILPHSDHLSGYTVRLESAFLEMAQSYYSQMSKRVRMHRDQLTSAHQTLRIRHQFKLGFISEMRSDFSTALKHYTQAYSNLDEIQIKEANCLELKTLAGFLNYKICKLMFKLKIPRDSINHFMNHIEKYKSHVGYKELLFEHYAWLSVQYSAFAELFCEAIKCGLPALQTQHPGIYFHKAAEYIGKRKEAFLQCCSLSLSPTDSEMNNATTKPTNLISDFYGIRNTSINGEFISEQQIISLVQDAERNFNHSASIITLLGQAMAQFKFYKCLRFRKKLAIDMAEEYFKCGDHAKALTLYSLMLPDYRQDEWNVIFTEVLLKTLRCAFLSASVADFMSCSIESLSPNINCDQKERIVVLENLWKVFQNVPPVSQSVIAPELRSSWEASLSAFKSPITVDLEKISGLFECIVSFDKAQIKNDDKVIVKLFIRSKTDVPLRIKQFSVVLSDGVENVKLKAINAWSFDSLGELRNNEFNGKDFPITKLDADFRVEPGKSYKILFDSESHQFLENIELQVSHVEIEMGTDRHYMVLTKATKGVNRPFRNYNRFKDLIDNIKYNPTCYVVPTFHLTTQNNQMQQMFVNEFFKVACSVTNTFNVFLQNVGISITVPSNFRNTVFLATDLTPNRQKLLSHIQFDIGELQMQGNSSIVYYVFSLSEANIELQQKVWYHLETSRPRLNSEHSLPEENTVPNKMEKFPCRISSNIKIEVEDGNRLKKIKEDVIMFSCVPEFKFSGRFYTLNRQPLLKAYRGENFLFRANIEVQTPCNIDILETYFMCDHNLNQSPYSFKRKKHSNIYSCGDNIEDIILLRSNVCTPDWVTQNNFEQSRDNLPLFTRFRKAARRETKSAIKVENSNAVTKNLNTKSSTNAAIFGGNLSSSQISNMSNSLTSEDGKLLADDVAYKDSNHVDTKAVTKVVYNRAKDALQATGHCRGFIKGISLYESASNLVPFFGVYCIKWRRTGYKDENESKFIISGIEVEEPLMNIYCAIEDKMFVKIPMTLKIVLNNPTSKVIHLIAALSNTDSFMCSGHKQLNISIFSQSEQELIYNLYPLKVGWQNLPDLTLEYNTQLDPDRDELQQSLLSHLVQRSMPKKVFILPPPKQHSLFK